MAAKRLICRSCLEKSRKAVYKSGFPRYNYARGGENI